MRAPIFEVVVGDVIETLRSFPARSVQCCITSPPYLGLRSYLPKDHPLKPFEIGAEKTPQEYVEKIIGVFREVRRVLRDDGVVFLNLGDCYNSSPPGIKDPMSKSGLNGAQTSESYRARLVETQQRGQEGRTLAPGLKVKDLVGIPWSVALALRADGWWLRSDIIWAKGTSGQKALHEEAAEAMREEGVDEETVQRVLARWEPYVGNCMPSSVEDRPTTSHEYVFLLAKSERYFYDHYAIREESTELTRPQSDKRRQARMNHAVGQVEGGGQSSKGDLAHGAASHVMRTNPVGRNIRTVWTIPTSPFPGAHFATFGEKLVEPMIRAGSSEGGCCGRCGAPRVRVVEEGEPLSEQRAACGADSTGGYSGESTKDHAANGVQDASAVKARILAGMVAKRTVAWVATCCCVGSDVQPCLVLDPFCGSGTVGAVCMKEGRDFVGIELFQENAEMARARIPDPDYAKKVRAAKRAEKQVSKEAEVSATEAVSS